MKISRPSSRQEAFVAWATRSRTLVNRFEVRFEDAQKFPRSTGAFERLPPSTLGASNFDDFQGKPSQKKFGNT